MRSTTFKDPHFFYDSLKHLLFLCTKPRHLWRQRPSLIRLLLLQSFVVDVSFVSFFAPPDFLMMLMKTSTEMFFPVFVQRSIQITHHSASTCRRLSHETAAYQVST